MNDGTSGRAGSEHDGSPRPVAAGGPPRAVRVAVVVLGLLALDRVATTVQVAMVSHLSGPELGLEIVPTLIGVAIDGLLARLLWRGSSTGRTLVVVFGALGIVATVVGLVGVQGVYRVWTVAVLVALMFTGATRSWCRGGRQDRSADRAREQRRQQRAGLSWGPRLMQTIRDDRDARR